MMMTAGKHNGEEDMMEAGGEDTKKLDMMMAAGNHSGEWNMKEAGEGRNQCVGHDGGCTEEHSSLWDMITTAVGSYHE